MAIYRLHQQKFESISKGGFPSKASSSNKAGKSERGKKGVSSGLSTVTQTAGVKIVHGKGTKKAGPRPMAGSQRDKLEDYDLWTSNDDWQGPSWMREPLGFQGSSISYNYHQVQDQYDIHIPSYWDEL